LVNGVATDILAARKPCIVDSDPDDDFYCIQPIVGVAGFPHGDWEHSPWLGRPYSIALPHNVECATFKAKVTALGRVIDIYTQYPWPYGGQGPNAPSDMFWPQKEVIICANVTYNNWPEQQKDVAFHVYMPDGYGGLELYTILYGKTNEYGMACVAFRLPWPCYDWPDVIGVWCIEAFVDIACEVVNDTLCFHYDYLVNIVDVETDKAEYKHCEDIFVTVYFTSHSQMDRNVTITVTILDETGVPFGYAEVEVTVGGTVFCEAKCYMIQVSMHVVKWARAGVATIYVGSYDAFGAPAGPVYEPPPTVAILAEWV
jgi:hypothetical protein